MLGDLDLAIDDLAPHQTQGWGDARFSGRLGGSPIDVSVYGRDAADAQLLAKTARFALYRDSGPTLALTRRQQVEHEAYVTMMAERAGARVPAILAAGPAGPARDALLVTRPPSGRPLAGFAPYVAPPASDGAAGNGAGEPASPSPRAERENGRPTGDVGPEAPVLAEAAVDSVFGQLRILRAAGIAHGAISIRTIVVDDAGRAGFVDFRRASTVATDDQLNRDLAATLAATALVVGPEHTVAAALRIMPPEAFTAALPYLQRAALDTAASRSLRGKKTILNAVREQGAAAAGVEVPKLIEPRRVSWVTLAMAVGTLIGGWALIGVLINVTKSWSTITGADWAWVAAVFVLAQAAYPAIAITTVGSVTDPLPYGRTVALEVADTFVALAGGLDGRARHQGPVLPTGGVHPDGGGELRRAGQYGQLDRQGRPLPDRAAPGSRKPPLRPAGRAKQQRGFPPGLAHPDRRRSWPAWPSAWCSPCPAGGGWRPRRSDPRRPRCGPTSSCWPATRATWWRSSGAASPPRSSWPWPWAPRSMPSGTG